jgi:hypothetical protein
MEGKEKFNNLDTYLFFFRTAMIEMVIKSVTVQRVAIITLVLGVLFSNSIGTSGITSDMSPVWVVNWMNTVSLLLLLILFNSAAGKVPSFLVSSLVASLMAVHTGSGRMALNIVFSDKMVWLPYTAHT